MKYRVCGLKNLIKDFQRIAKAAGMKPTDRNDMAEIASPDGEDAYVLRLGAVTDGSEVDAIWLSLQRGLRREDGREWLTPRTGRVLRCRIWDAEAGWLEPVAGENAINRLRGLVDELYGWAEAERTAWVHARAVSRLLDGRVDGLAGMA